MRMKTNAVKAEPAKQKLIVENVVILDASGSMGTYGGVDDKGNTKYNNAIGGINIEVETLKKDENAEHLYTMVEFSDILPGNSITHFKMTPVDKVTVFHGAGAMGGTPLYSTMSKVLTELLYDVTNGLKTHKILVKIFTDGQDTSRWRYDKINKLVELIKDCEQSGIVITFMATIGDKAYIENTLTIKSDNIYAYENTAVGTTNAFVATTASTVRFTKSMARGASADNLERGFFTRTDKEAEEGK